MPVVAEEMWERLGLTAAGVKPEWKDAEAGKLPAGVKVAAGQPLFPRVEIDRALARLTAEVEKEEKATAPAPPEAPATTPTLSYEEFRKLDLRSGRVLEIERVPKSDKLYRLMVDLGEEAPRQVVAGLAQDFPPEELMNKCVVVVANLEPAVIRGVRSHGMLLAVGEEKPVALVVTDRDCPPGSVVR